MHYPRRYLLRSLIVLVALTILLTYMARSFKPGFIVGPKLQNIQVPDDLEVRTLERFDELVRKGVIFHEEVTPELVLINGFQFEFVVTPILARKPVLSADDPSRSKAGGPFINPDPDEIIADLGSSHRLWMNKYGVFRPMLVIPTNKYARQSDDLDISDVESGWAVLQAFKTPSLMIYNHGVNSGSSQGHKHTQVLPLPAHELWPSKAQSATGVATNLTDVPFKHFVLRLPENADAQTVYTTYLYLLGLSREALAKSGSGSNDYNVAITKEWVAVIPRRNCDGPYGSNAAGMLGIIYVPDQVQRNKWAEVEYTKHLATLGIPVE